MPEDISALIVSQAKSLTNLHSSSLTPLQGDGIDERLLSLERSSSIPADTDPASNEAPAHQKRNSIVNHRDSLHSGKPRSKSILRDGKVREFLKRPPKEVSISNKQTAGTQTCDEDWQIDASLEGSNPNFINNTGSSLNQSEAESSSNIESDHRAESGSRNEESVGDYKVPHVLVIGHLTETLSKLSDLKN